MASNTTPTSQQVERTVRVLHEGIKYEASNTERKEIRSVLEKIIRSSMFIPDEKKEFYLKPLSFLKEELLWQFKDVFIHENLRHLESLVEHRIIERQMIDSLAGGGMMKHT